jgi:hypothetical protein
MCGRHAELCLIAWVERMMFAIFAVAALVYWPSVF